MIALIAAYANNRVIGRDGKIPWSIPGEQNRFRALTTGNVVVMGRRTYEEIGRPLPDRDTIVISSTLHLARERCVTAPSLAQALAQAGGRQVFICGGEGLYREALPFADVLYLTEIEAEFQGDRYFPAFDPEQYLLTEETRVDGPIPYTCRTYRRKAMTWEQIQARMAEIQAESGVVLGLGPLRSLLARLGNPQDRTRYLHIGGTNGKGSVGAMLRTVLQKAGYRVGHYSSPAVFHPLEPWRVNDTLLTKRDYCARMTRILSHRDAMARQGEPLPTAFELETALAFLTFAEEHCDLAVLECGMGGAGDATNVVTTTLISLLTSIGLDHIRFLGETLEQIAENKSGIFRDGVPAVIQAQSGGVEAVLCRICRQRGIPLYRTAPAALTADPQGAGSLLRYRGKEWRLSLQGQYQAANAAQVIETVMLLRAMGFPVPEQALADGLAHTCWPGRFETICTAPRVILDGAHNPDAAKRLRESLDALYREGFAGRLYCIMGVLADKDYTEVAAQIAPLAECVYTVTPATPRALAAEELARCVKAFCPNVCPMPLSDAVAAARRESRPEDLILVFGSLSYLSAARELLCSEEGQHGTCGRNCET